MFYYKSEDGTLFTSKFRLDYYIPISQAEYEKLMYEAHEKDVKDAQRETSDTREN